MLYYNADEKKTYALDYRERAPIDANENMFLDADGNVFKINFNSYLAAGIPGTVKGMFTIHELFGSKSMDDLISPSVKLASEGFRLSDFQANNFNKYRKVLKWL